MPEPTDEPTFEDALAELETLIHAIESGEVGLEQAIDRYEKGVALIARCREILGRAEARIAELRVGPDGSLEGDPSAGSTSGADA